MINPVLLRSYHVFNHLLLLDPIDRSTISSDRIQILFGFSPYNPSHFLRTLLLIFITIYIFKVDFSVKLTLNIHFKISAALISINISLLKFKISLIFLGNS